MAAVLESMVEDLARTRVLRGCAGDAPWELWRRAPHDALRGAVLELWAGLVSQVARHRVLPNGEVMLMFHLGMPQRLTERGGVPSEQLLRIGFVAGLQERPATYESFDTETRVVCARLSPLGAYRLLGGLPQAELTGCVVEIDAALARRDGVADLHGRMTDAPNLGVALAMLEHWLLRRLAAPPAAHPAVRMATGLLERTHGTMPVTGVARATGVSQRRLRDLLLREVGVSAKRLARILRFRATLEQLARARDADLSQLALDCGYYDQPHMNREFRALAAMTPVQYLAVLGDGLDGADVVSP